MSAPIRPCVSTLPAYGYMTRPTILSNVDLPDPLCPISPTASPGLMSNERSRSAHRYDFKRASPSLRLSDPSRNFPRAVLTVFSARKRFQIPSARNEPSGNIAEPGLHPLEHHPADCDPHDRRHERDRQQAELRREPEQHGVAERLDDRAEWIDRRVQ